MHWNLRTLDSISRFFLFCVERSFYALPELAADTDCIDTGTCMVWDYCGFCRAGKGVMLQKSDITDAEKISRAI